MAVYKVPQDVEADDKLLGPLSFRQFIYAVVAVIACAVAYILSMIFIGLIIIPLPIIILATVLALPLRKDQPMELYLIAIIRFMLKPRLRIWAPEGAVNLVEIVAPRAVEEQRTNNLHPDEARDRLDYLAKLMDTRGWSAKNTSYANPALQTMQISEADISNDIMDKDASVGQNFDNLIAKNDAQRMQETRQRLEASRVEASTGQYQSQAQPAMQVPGSVSLDQIISQQQQTSPATQTAQGPQQAQTPDENITFDYNPYPSSIRQHVIQPLDPAHQQRQPVAQQPVQSVTPPVNANPPENTIPTAVSPDIIRLATESKNLSISTLAHEAHRLEQKHEDEVVINLH